ncbi:sensor histidine kinase [Actinocrispum wychmicini]|uniref:histidine kinase n=1 Tax=Actinocrispum wychmicini TaxID=1213861 RepID=A0A4V2S545_9PSEU|nr:HAMP domain-containing sensor histidine kinase [Actinocrispum wychmicini]TCO50760.1 two-component system OmpR family sensor kinase [Actinocrispum wychmicini]
MNRWRRTSLGTRLALAIGVLSLVVFAIVGIVLVDRTRHFLESQFDANITKSQQMWAAKSKYQQPLPQSPGWYSATFTVYGGKAMLQQSSQDLPDPDDFARAAEKAVGRNAYFDNVSLRNEGTFRVRACPYGTGQVLVTAASFAEIDNTVSTLVILLASTFAVALIVLVVAGRFVLRKGLRPLSDMAATAHDITSHDLTDSGHLSVRAAGAGGGPEVEELRTSFNVMLDHIDQSLAARTAAEQRLRRFIADASHELRTPLTSIRGYADLFQYAAANEPQEREAHLTKIRAETERMSVLVDDLLLLARLDADSPLRLEDINLVEVASAAADAFVAAHPDYPLDFDAPSNVPVHGDPMRLRQVFDNLLANIARHTPAGTSVEFSVSPAAVATVTDTGPGIPAEHLSRIFDRFYRIDDSRSRNIGGTGLGLSIVHSIVTAHGGTVTVASHPGRTTFTLTVPPM